MDHLEELKNEKLWMNYTLYPRKNGGMGKPPINPYTLKNGSSTDPEQWSDYATAKKNIDEMATFKPSGDPVTRVKVAGTGIVTTNKYCGIDLDHVLKDGEIEAPFVKKLLEMLDTYAEVSVSGDGLHLLLYTEDLPEEMGRKFKVDGEGNKDKDGKYEIEIYAYKTGGRFFTISENVFYDRPINKEKIADLQKIYHYYNRSETVQAQPQSPASSPVGSGNPPQRADAEVIEKAFRYDYDGSFRKLYEGDTSLHGGDHSRADQALANKLAQWTNGNRDQMDRIFRSSGLMRDKWDRPIKRGSDETYGQRTINKALENFTPYTRPEDAGLTVEDVKQAIDKEQQEQQEQQEATVPNVPDVNARELSKPKLIKPLTYERAVETLQNAIDDSIMIPNFESFATQAKIGQHDTVIIAGETGSGKSMLALNLMENLNQTHAVMYFNLEMTTEMVLRRMVSIHSGLELDRVEGYKKDEETAKTVNENLKEITNRQPIYVENDRYKLDQIEDAIKQAAAIQEANGRTEPVIVFIDHVLLLRNVGKASSNYERFSGISEELRRIAVLNNCIVFVLTQQSRAGKADKDKEPELSSLKESGSFENDSTHTCFVWRSGIDGRYYLVLRKNRKGESETKWELDIDFKTQTVKAPRNGLPLMSISDPLNAELPEARPTRKKATRKR